MSFTKNINISVHSKIFNEKVKTFLETNKNSPQLNEEAFSNLEKASSLLKETSQNFTKSLERVNTAKFDSKDLEEIKASGDLSKQTETIAKLWASKQEKAKQDVSVNYEKYLRDKYSDDFDNVDEKAFNQAYTDFLIKLESGIDDWVGALDEIKAERSDAEIASRQALSILAKTQENFLYKFNKKDLNAEELEEYKEAKRSGAGDEYLKNIAEEKEVAWKENMNEAFTKKYDELVSQFKDEKGETDLQKVQEEFRKFTEKVASQKDAKDALKSATKNSGVKMDDSLNFSKMGKFKDGIGKFGKVLNKGWGGIKSGFDMGSKVLSQFGIDMRGILDFFKGVLKDAIEEFKNMTKFRSDGRYTTLETEEEKAELGANSDAEFYAIKKATEKMNMSKDEFFMGGVNEERNKYLQQLLEIEKKKYEDMEKSGALKKLEDAQQKWENFRNELRGKVMEVLAEFAPLFLDALNAILGVLRPILDAIKNMFALMKDETMTQDEVNSEIDSIINKYSMTTNNNNIAITNNMHSVNPGISNRHQLEKSGQQNGVTISRALGY